MTEIIKDLIPEGAEVLELDPDEIVAIKDTHDRVDYGDVDGLAESIKQEGQIQPIIITRKSNGSGGYHNIVVAGRRRRQACKKLGIKVKCIVVDPTDKAHLLDIQLAENVFRKDFDPLEFAEALTLRKKHYDAEREKDADEKTRPRFALAMAQRFGVDETTIRRLMEPASLPEDVRARIKEVGISPAQRRILVQDAIKAVKIEKKRQELEQRKHKRYKPRTQIIKGAKWALHNGYVVDLISEHVKENSVDMVLTYHRPEIDHEWVRCLKPYLASRAQIIILCDTLKDAGIYSQILNDCGYILQEGLHMCKEGVVIPEGSLLNYHAAMTYMVRASVHDRFYFNAGKQVNYCFHRDSVAPDDLGPDARNPPNLYVRDIVRECIAQKHLVIDPFANMGTIMHELINYKREVIGFEYNAILYKYARKRLKRITEREKRNGEVENDDE